MQKLSLLSPKYFIQKIICLRFVVFCLLRAVTQLLLPDVTYANQKQGCNPWGLRRFSPLVNFIGAFGTQPPFDFQLFGNFSLIFYFAQHLQSNFQILYQRLYKWIV